MENLIQNWLMTRRNSIIIIIISSVLLILIQSSTTLPSPPPPPSHLIPQSGSNLGTLVSSLLKRQPPPPPSFPNHYAQNSPSNDGTTAVSQDNVMVVDNQSIEQLPTVEPLHVLSAVSVRDRTQANTDVTDRSISTNDETVIAPDSPLSIENETIVTTKEAGDDLKNYNERLTNILKNVQHLLPLLTQLQQNMTDLLQQPQSTSHIIVLENSNIIGGGGGGAHKSDEIGSLLVDEKTQLKSEEFSFPIPSSTTPLDDPEDAENPGYITQLIHTLYPHKPFEEVVKIVKTMARPSQEVAYQVLADRVFTSYRNKTGRMDVIDMACEIYGKPQFKKIVHKNEDILMTFVFPSFFDGGLNFYLEAKSKSDVPKNLYFDRRKHAMGITTSELTTPGTFQTWTFLPVNDGCYFVLKSSQSDFIVGVIVTKSKESPLFARNVVGVTGLEEGKINYRFQWKILPYKLRDFDRTHILLENRETNLALEWDEFGNVNLNSVTFHTSQLWSLG